MDNLMELYLKERNNHYFRDYALAQLKIAQRVVDYFEPDDYDTYSIGALNNELNELLKSDSEALILIAAEKIIDEVGYDCSSSVGTEELLQETVKAIQLVKERTHDNKNKELIKRKAKLELELRAIEEQIIDTRSKYVVCPICDGSRFYGEVCDRCNGKGYIEGDK